LWEVDERVKAEEKDDYKEDAKNVESNEPKETKMSEDEEGKEQSKYSHEKKENEAVNWTIENVKLTKDVFIDDDKEQQIVKADKNLSYKYQLTMQMRTWSKIKINVWSIKLYLFALS
jgi:hypothetical protein